MLCGSEISDFKNESKNKETNLLISEFQTELKSYRHSQTGTLIVVVALPKALSIKTNGDSEQLFTVFSGGAISFAFVTSHPANSPGIVDLLFHSAR